MRQCLLTESKEQGFTIMYDAQGTKLLVLEGLDFNQQISLYPMQQVLVPHLSSFVVLYWALLLCVSVYLVGNYVVKPLTHRFRDESHYV